jgi:hypothetical protein
MPKKIPLDSLIGTADASQLGEAFRSVMSKWLKANNVHLYVSDVQVGAERDANANRWVAVKLRLKDLRRADTGKGWHSAPKARPID